MWWLGFHFFWNCLFHHLAVFHFRLGFKVTKYYVWASRHRELILIILSIITSTLDWLEPITCFRYQGTQQASQYNGNIIPRSWSGDNINYHRLHRAIYNSCPVITSVLEHRVVHSKSEIVLLLTPAIHGIKTQLCRGISCDSLGLYGINKVAHARKESVVRNHSDSCPHWQGWMWGAETVAVVQYKPVNCLT